MAALITLLMVQTAAASPFEVYGFGSRATAMGGAQGAASRDHAAIYYNPANLTLRDKTTFGLSLHLVMPSLYSGAQPTDPDTQNAMPEPNLGATIGFNFPLGGRLDYRVAIGLAIFLPLIELTRLEAIDPSRPYFYIYQSLPDHLVLAPAIGVRITDWLRVGAGLQILAALGVDLDVTGDVVRRRIEERSLAVDLSGTLGPIVGISSTLGPLELGITFRDDLELGYNIPVDFLLEDVGTVALSVSGVTLYSPRQLNFGLSYTFEDPALIVAADATWSLWDEAPNPAARVDAVLTDEELRPEEGEVATLFEFHTPPFDLGARDILVPRLGLEWHVNETYALRAGYFFRAAVTPDQSGYSNILDCASDVFSIGAGATFADPLQVHRQPISFNLHIQLTHLRDRLTVKEPTDTPTVEGDYLSGGSIGTPASGVT
jgi:long-chain fatty acid transport protein